MKKLILPAVFLASAVLVNGCSFSMGGGSRTESHKPTLGQQLIDLKTAKDNGAITEAEYQTQKAKLLSDQGKQP